MYILIIIEWMKIFSKKKLYSTEFISALGLLWKIVYIQFMYAQAETTYKALIP